MTTTGGASYDKLASWRRLAFGVLVQVEALLMHIWHYNDVIMGTMASQINSLTIVYSTVYSGADQRKHQSSAALAFVRDQSQCLAIVS